MILGNGAKWNLRMDYEYNILKKLIHKNINYLKKLKYLIKK